MTGLVGKFRPSIPLSQVLNRWENGKVFVCSIMIDEGFIKKKCPLMFCASQYTQDYASVSGRIRTRGNMGL